MKLRLARPYWNKLVFYDGERPKTATNALPTRLSPAPIRSPPPLAPDVSGKVRSRCRRRISVTNGEEKNVYNAGVYNAGGWGMVTIGSYLWD